MLDAFDIMLYSLVLTTLMREFGISKGAAGLLNGLTLAASAIGSFVFGLLADRYGRRRMLSLSILTYSLFTFACGFTTTMFALAVCRFLLGLGMGGEWNSGATLVAETWPSAWRGRAIGIVQSSWAVGYALDAVIAGVVLVRNGNKSSSAPHQKDSGSGKPGPRVGLKGRNCQVPSDEGFFASHRSTS